MARSKDGTDFRSNDSSLHDVLDRVRRERTRVRVTYDGDWGDNGKDHEYGYIGRTLGNPNYPNGGSKAPILVHNSRSMGGDILFDDHIIKVETSRGKRLLWKKNA